MRNKHSVCTSKRSKLALLTHVCTSTGVAQFQLALNTMQQLEPASGSASEPEAVADDDRILRCTDLLELRERDLMMRIPEAWLSACYMCVYMMTADGCHLRCGSACSGSGMGDVVMQRICRMANSVGDTAHPITHQMCFACEFDERKANWLLTGEGGLPSDCPAFKHAGNNEWRLPVLLASQGLGCNTSGG